MRSARSRFHYLGPRPKGFILSKKPRPSCSNKCEKQHSKTFIDFEKWFIHHGTARMFRARFHWRGGCRWNLPFKKLFSDGNFPYTHVKNSAFAIKGDFNWVMRKLLFQGRSAYDLKNFARIICAATMFEMQMRHTRVRATLMITHSPWKRWRTLALMYSCIYIIHLRRLQQLAWLRFCWFRGWNLKVMMHPGRKK